MEDFFSLRLEFSRPLTSRRGSYRYFGRFPLEIHMQLVSIGRALGAVGPLLALLLAVLAPSATDGAASVTDENADVHYGLVNAQLNVGTMNSPSKRAAQGLAGNNWGIAIDGDSIPIDTATRVPRHSHPCNPLTRYCTPRIFARRGQRRGSFISPK